jgi:hypothetical protein
MRWYIVSFWLRLTRLVGWVFIRVPRGPGERSFSGRLGVRSLIDAATLSSARREKSTGTGWHPTGWQKESARHGIEW